MESVDHIAALHRAQRPLVALVTGGGAVFISDLLRVPGASSTVLEAAVPYSPSALAEWLGKPPEQACSQRTALALASVAYARSRALFQRENPDDSRLDNCLGVACTAALVSDRPKRGAHRAHIAVQSRDTTLTYELVLEKGARHRAAEDSLVADVLLQAVLEIAELPIPGLRALRAGDLLLQRQILAHPVLRGVWQMGQACAYRLPTGEWLTAPPIPIQAVLPGSFDPLHFGHQQLQSAAAHHLELPVQFELSIGNVDKPPLDYLTVSERLAQFTEHPVLVTNASTFQRKAELFPRCVFVVGIDTAVRIVDPRYYGHQHGKMEAALAQIRSAGCRFLVAGRLQAGTWNTLAAAPELAPFRDLFEELPETEFRADVSSTALRCAQHRDE